VSPVSPFLAVSLAVARTALLASFIAARSATKVEVRGKGGHAKRRNVSVFFLDPASDRATAQSALSCLTREG
jgi:hypothetical protein